MTAALTRQDPFRDVLCSPLGHYALVQTALALRIVANLAEAPGHDDESWALGEFPVLAEILESAESLLPQDLSWPERSLWWDAHARRWERRVRCFLPLRRIAISSKLDFEAEVAAVLVGCVESDVRLGAMVAALQGTPNNRRPTLSLVGSFTDTEARAGLPVPEVMLREGYFRIVDTSGVQAERHLRLAHGLANLIFGQPLSVGYRVIGEPRSAPKLADMLLPEAAQEPVRALPRVIRAEGATTVVVQGADGSDRVDLLRAVARAMRRRSYEMVWPRTEGPATGATPELWDEIGPLFQVARVMPILRVDAAPGQTVEIPRLPGYDGVLGIVLGRHGGVAGEGAERAVHVDLPHPDAEERAAHWAREFQQVDAPSSAELGRRLRLTPAYIRQAALQARASARLAGREAVVEEDIGRALGAINRHRLEPLAQRVETCPSWDDLEVPEPTWKELQELERRCRAREALVDVAGRAFEGSLNRGVRALFSGPTGTGKTLAARVLTGVLGMDLYRVDLAAVVDKYVGETEKRLSRLLSTAEELDVVLLLDEGDALLTGRTDVRGANDRYANMETNFLLQRLEAYEGIFLVTTNAGNRIDKAFQRRFDASVDFPPPGPDERRAILDMHLPEEHDVPLANRVRLAARARLTGGQIRNAALFATLLALGRGGGALVQTADLEEAFDREFRKAGSTTPARESAEERAAGSTPRQVERLLERLGQRG